MLAGALGLSADSVSAAIQAQMAQFGGMQRGGRNQEAGLPSMGGPPRGMRMMPGEVALDAQGAQRQAPPVSEAECAKVREAMAKKPDVAKKLQDLRQKMMSGEIDFAAMREQSQALYKEAGVDPMSARGCMGGGRQGGATPDAGAAAPGQQRGSRGDSTRARNATPAGAQAQATPQQSGEFPARTRSRTAVVFVAENGSYTPRVVRLGVANFDYTEVLSGLKDGDQVALLATAALQAARDSSNARFRQMTGGGAMPGMQKQGTGGTGGGAPPPPRT
jgi:hypothetical protein